MKLPWSILGLLLLPASEAAQRLRPTRDYDAYDYYAVHVKAGIDAREVSDSLGLQYEGPLGELDNHHIFYTSQRQHEYDHVKSEIRSLEQRRRKREEGALSPHILDNIRFSQKQELHKRFPLVKRGYEQVHVDESEPLYRRQQAAEDYSEAVEIGMKIAQNLSITDPIFHEQWHLYNPRQLGHDINVTGVWQQGVTGKGSTVCIVDDGLDMDSDDLKPNYDAAGSWDYNDPGPDPKPRLSDDRHGTRCAGEVSAARNNVCGVGVAYDSQIAGVRILSKIISDADEAESLNYGFQKTQIYSCSWGPPDDGQAMEGPSILIKSAMVNGVQKGRDGKGSIFVFAIGNGAANDDNCNFDGYTNSIYSVSVGGIDRKGLHPYYSEKCAAQLVVTYSSGSGDAIHTTDVGQDSCYTNHGGTSAAGPLVAGIYALMLEVNPDLTWRDIQYLTIITAVYMPDQPDDYQMNAAMGKHFGHQFGYGKADAYAMVEAARNWTNVKPQAWYFSPWLHVKHEIPQGDKGLASSFEVTQDMLTKANLERIEHVTVTMNVEHTRRGDLSVELRSPTGMVSHIATHRRNDNANRGYQDWTFMSVAHWGESGVGKWTVVVKDTLVNEHKGQFTDWHLKLYGESIDGENQPLLNLPTAHDDDDHDSINPPQTAGGHTTTVAIPSDHTGTPQGNPTDHIDRPTKPTATATVTTPPSPVEDEHSPATHTMTPTPTPTTGTNFLPHPFPTFGVSKHTQIWIYGSVLLIVAFLASLGTWIYFQRRKKRTLRDDYGFEMIGHEDGDDSGMPLTGRSGRRRQRGNDLYDAFAEGTDEESVDGSLVEEETQFELAEESEDEDDGEGKEGRYRDKDEDSGRGEGLDVQ